MPKRVGVFASGDLTYVEKALDLFVGVDRASLFLIGQGLPLDLAIGDFDSVTLEELTLIHQKAKRVITAPSQKDDTDTELALKTIWQEDSEALVTVFGALGGRLDHALSNLFMVSDEALYPFMRQLRLCDAQNRVSYYPRGEHQIGPGLDATYISFMLSGEGRLTILDAKYELTEENYFQKKIYASNEFLDGPIRIKVEDDYLVVIEAKD